MRLFNLSSVMPRGVYLSVAMLSCLVCCVVMARAADPGNPLSADAGVNDQKMGSVLVYVVYTSSATTRGEQNTRINIKNHSTVSAAFVHLYFVSDITGAIADAFICLFTTQTASFLASDIDPGITGYLVAVVVDGVNGCPLSFNSLSGDEYLKLSGGHLAQINATTFAAGYSGVMAGCNANSTTATLLFNGSNTGYDQVPRVLAAEKIPSPTEGNNTMFFLMRLGGNFAVGLGNPAGNALGSLTGFLVDDASNQYPFSLTTSNRLLAASISNSFPATTPNVSVLVPPSRRAWMKIYSTDDVGLLGALISFNPNMATTRTAFSGGQSLHALTLSTSNSLIVPVFPPSC